MLSVLIETRDHEEALARTLASIVGAAVEGVVRDVVICDQGSVDQTHYVAEHAGCHFIARGGLAAGVSQARGEWLLFLEPGARMVEGWTDAVVAHTATQTGRARFTQSEPRSWWSTIFSGREPLADGLLIMKREAAVAITDSTCARDLARATKSTRIDGKIVAP